MRLRKNEFKLKIEWKKWFKNLLSKAGNRQAVKGNHHTAKDKP